MCTCCTRINEKCTDRGRGKGGGHVALSSHNPRTFHDESAAGKTVAGNNSSVLRNRTVNPGGITHGHGPEVPNEDGPNPMTGESCNCPGASYQYLEPVTMPADDKAESSGAIYDQYVKTAIEIFNKRPLEYQESVKASLERGRAT